MGGKDVSELSNPAGPVGDTRRVCVLPAQARLLRVILSFLILGSDSAHMRTICASAKADYRARLHDQRAAAGRRRRSSSTSTRRDRDRGARRRRGRRRAARGRSGGRARA